MLTHYFEIQVAENLNPTMMYATTLHRLHGFHTSGAGKALAIDLPRWEGPAKFMGARPGNTLRILGEPEALSQLLKQTGLFQFLMESGITMAGIQPVPPDVQKFAVVRRDYSIRRLEELLTNPKLIKADESAAKKAPESLLKLAGELNCSAQQLLAVDSVLKRRHKARASCVALSMPSKSTGRMMIIDLNRSESEFSFNEEGFSSYGLSIGGSSVPTW
jgi:CRISPR-associated endoribonuclease Cas6/Csy4 subtype I-F